MKINILKLLSIAVCCLIPALWSEARCADDQPTRDAYGQFLTRMMDGFELDDVRHSAHAQQIQTQINAGVYENNPGRLQERRGAVAHYQDTMARAAFDYQTIYELTLYQYQTTTLAQHAQWLGEKVIHHRNLGGEHHDNQAFTFEFIRTRLAARNWN